MKRMHSPHRLIKNKTRCGMPKADVWSTYDEGRVTCERCLINIKWEKEKWEKEKKAKEA